MRMGEKPNFVSVHEVTSHITLRSLVLTLASSQDPEVTSQPLVESSRMPGMSAILFWGAGGSF